MSQPTLDDIASLDGEAFAKFAQEYSPDMGEASVSEQAEQTPTDELEDDAESFSEEATDDFEEDEGEGTTDFYKALTAPIKAAGKEFTFTDPEEIRTLLQKGIGFEQRMGHLKKFQRHIETLDKENLLNDNTLNLIVDLARGKPEALKRYIVSNKIDVYDIIGLDESEYTPEKHIPSEDEYEQNIVKQEILALADFDLIEPLLADEWDKESQKKLLADPALAKNLIQAAKVGIHDLILKEAQKVKLLASQPMSDIEAYMQAGNKLHKQGAFDKMTKRSSNVDETIKPKNVTAHNVTAQRTKKPKTVKDLASMSEAELRAFAAANNL